jgi:hypothetical protein
MSNPPELTGIETIATTINDAESPRFAVEAFVR